MTRSYVADSLFARMKRDTGVKWQDYYAKRADELKLRLFRPQLDLVNDKCRTKAALCPRRAGKSSASAVYMLLTALKKRDAQVLYITLTRGSAKRIMWSELKKLNRAYELVDPVSGFHETDLLVRFENQSIIQLLGCETLADVEKVRGGQYDLVIIDECASMSADLFMALIDDAVSPALSDREGTLLIIGTPGRILSGPFYACTGPNAFQIGDHPMIKGTKYATSRPYEERDQDRWDEVMYGWSFHRWMTKDNTAMPNIWVDQQNIKLRNGWDDDHPQWRREYLGQWVADDSGFVYRYNPERNDWEPSFDEDSDNPWGLPQGHEWRFIVGVDLGYDDDTSVVAAAWSETHPDFYHVESFSSPHMEVIDVAGKIAEFHDRYKPDAIVADRGNLSKMVVATLNNQYGLPVEAAEKAEKRDFIELLNSDLHRGRCHILKGSLLGVQMATLCWDQKNPKIEDRDTPNHEADAFLYLWRYAYHHFSRKRHVEIEVGSKEYWNERMREAADKAAEAKRRWNEMAWDEKVEDMAHLDEGPMEAEEWVN